MLKDSHIAVQNLIQKGFQVVLEDSHVVVAGADLEGFLWCAGRTSSNSSKSGSRGVPMVCW